MIRTEAAAETMRSRTQSPRPADLSDVTGAGSFAGGVVAARSGFSRTGDQCFFRNRMHYISRLLSIATESARRTHNSYAIWLVDGPGLGF